MCAAAESAAVSGDACSWRHRAGSRRAVAFPRAHAHNWLLSWLLEATVTAEGPSVKHRPAPLSSLIDAECQATWRDGDGASGCRRRFREVHIKFFQRFDDDARDGEVAEPYVIGGDDEPRSIFGAAARKGGLIGGDVVVPVLSFLQVGFGKFPLLTRIMEPLLKTPLLFFPADMQEKFQDLDVIFLEVPFKAIDFSVSRLPHFLGNELVDANHEDVFIMRAVKNADHAFCGDCLVNAPEEVVSEFFGIRNLECGHRTSLRANAGHDMANGSILAGSIHPLQDNKQRSFLFGVKKILQLVQPLDRLLELVLSLVVIVVAQSVGGVELCELDFLVRRDHQFADKVQECAPEIG